MFKMFNSDTEWDIFQNVIHCNKQVAVKSKKEKLLMEEIKKANWRDNTSTRPDFISDNLMIEMFEIDDIVTKKKGKNNPQRKANARAFRDVEEWMSKFPDGTFNDNLMVIAQGDTRYNPQTEEYTPDDSISHHNYQAYLNNFNRICQKHLDSVDAYKSNYPNKQLGFLIMDDSTYYMKKNDTNRITTREAFLSLPVYDKNFMKLVVKSKVDFILWAFNNKYFYTEDHPHGEESFLPKIILLTKDNYYSKHSKTFDVHTMMSLEE